MAKEIERKYLVNNMSFLSMAVSRTDMSQGYLCTDADATVRVRASGDKAWITVKSRNRGAVRGEWEYPVPVEDAEEMIANCCGSRIISKTRYIVPAGGGLKWEVDVFHGRHEGLVMAEIELPTVDTPFDLPAFVGREVTGDPQYYNSVLSGI